MVTAVCPVMEEYEGERGGLLVPYRVLEEPSESPELLVITAACLGFASLRVVGNN